MLRGNGQIVSFCEFSLSGLLVFKALFIAEPLTERVLPLDRFSLSCGKSRAPGAPDGGRLCSKANKSNGL